MKVLICAHDSGGANILAAWVRHHPENHYIFVLEGPAIKAFEKITSEVESRKRLDQLLEVDWVLTGTGWKSDLEKRAIQRAKSQGIRVVSYVDHWTNYRKRFDLGGEMVFPDEIWVGDSYGLQLAQEQLPEIHHVKQVTNFYLTEILDRIQSLSQVKAKHGRRIKILYLAQPISEAAKEMTGDPRGYGYTEDEALERYLLFLNNQMGSVAEFRLRHHPAENPGKYEKILSPFQEQMKVSFSTSADLAEDCAWADWVVGCDTMAMAIAAQAKKEVFCCIPPGGKKMAIPMEGIQQLYR